MIELIEHLINYISPKKTIPRKETLSELALELDMNFEYKTSSFDIQKLKDFHLFHSNSYKYIYNILSEKDELKKEQLKVFDFIFQSNKNSTNHLSKQTVFFSESKNYSFPKFHLLPRTQEDKLLRNIFRNSDNGNFIENPSFNKNYAFYYTDEEDTRIKSLFNNELIDLINNHQGKISIEANNYFLIVYFKNKLLENQQIKTLIKEGKNILKQLNNNG